MTVKIGPLNDQTDPLNDQTDSLNNKMWVLNKFSVVLRVILRNIEKLIVVELNRPTSIVGSTERRNIDREYVALNRRI